ncbi:LOW QUALITY PROTEIN: RUS family member 1 [Melanerpes formicivorus]|uniref:LOW QUALITY PROTEIN: RUS family member 1 n=1 Tax=Melanerpes formicivorus TaxID=211600 RepID=UPI00358E9B23
MEAWEHFCPARTEPLEDFGRASVPAEPLEHFRSRLSLSASRALGALPVRARSAQGALPAPAACSGRRQSPVRGRPPPACAGSCGGAARPLGTGGGPRGSLLREQTPGSGTGSALRRALEELLLPQGYPESVSGDYLQYQCWDSLQALSSSLSGALGTRAVLQAVGVGDGAATATGATLGWLLRDGVGIVTRISFAWLQGSRLDCEAKQWRLAADVLNDVALVLELLAPAWPRAALPLLTLAATTKCIVGVAGGATRAALALHQARRDNVADVAAKDGSQETLVNGAGLLLALLLLPLLDGRPWLTWAAVLLLLATHLGANLAAVRALRLRTLNRPRLRLSLATALRGGAWRGGGATFQVPSPDYVNPREPLLPGSSSRLKLHLGAPLHRLVSSEAELRKALESSPKDYIIVLRPSEGWVGVGLRRGAPPDASLRGCSQALLLEELLGPDLPTGSRLGAQLGALQRRLKACAPGSVPWGAVAESSRLWERLGPALLEGLAAAGWQTERPLLAADQWELEWEEP